MIKAELLTRLDKISARRWDRLTGNHVFLSHAFLSSLEESGSVAAETGWQPCHLILEQENQLVGAMPLYLKAHSQGEYVFDHNWALALEHSGGDYYPKLVCAIPFTPVNGDRLLGAAEYHPTLLAAASKTMLQLEASSLHINFSKQQAVQNLNGHNFIPRTSYQFHWHNDYHGQPYHSFDDFLASLTSRRRKSIRKERKTAQENLTLKHLTGSDLTETVWDHFFDFYMDTGARKWGRPYLNRTAFSLLGERLADRILLILAEQAGRPIAAALNFIDADRLYGRYWGCLAYHPFLHFELSYYQAIDYAIAHGLAVVEAGAQGQHKIERGYLPVKTYSAHRIAHRGLAHAVSDYLQHENSFIDAEIKALNKIAPFRKN